MEGFGHVPLPPYIQRTDVASDVTEYQTIFASEPGAIAAPTAGLHFTPEVFADLQERGVETVSITLHVGVGTFMPVRTEDPTAHRLRPERLYVGSRGQIEFGEGRGTAHHFGRYDINENSRVRDVETRTLRSCLRDRGYVHSSRLSISGDRWIADKFSPSSLDAFDAGVRICI